MDNIKSEERLKLMRGQLEMKPAVPSNIVRVFVSSTFSDMSQERNALYNHAYPDLREFCQSLGLEFQVIDMRWGVRDTATVDHSTTALCLLEVDTCKRVSVGPYFAVFLGNRYGYQPLPPCIAETTFSVINGIANQNGLDTDGLLQKWYKVDNNRLPPSRILEPITKYFPHFDDDDAELAAEKEKSQQQWYETFERLSDILKKSVQIAVKSGALEKKNADDFAKSVTQMEIEEAMRQRSGDFFHAYSRDICDLKNNLDSDEIAKFLDFSDEGKRPDHLKQKLLKSLKNRVKRYTKAAKTFKQYSIKFEDLSLPPGIYWNSISANNSSVERRNPYNGNQKTHPGDSYLNRICSDFMSDIKQSIAKHLSAPREKKKAESSKDNLLSEVLHHAAFARSKTQDFCGRDAMLNSITGAIEDSTNKQPIVLVGASGSGKTSVMAKLIDMQRLNSPNTIILYRFLGTSPESSSIHKLLQSPPASHQLQNFRDTVELFVKLIKVAPKYMKTEKDMKLVIFLDSIDQLLTDDGAHRMTWLPKILPERVKIVISSLPEPDFNIVPIMRRYVVEDNIYPISSLGELTAREIVLKWLTNIGRCLTAMQLQKVIEAFKKSPNPLFLKLIFEEAKKWRSHIDVDEIVLPATSRTAISQFYEKLEKDHGKKLVASALGFLIAARDGVTENELQDLLSLDNEVLHDVYEHWSPPSEGIVRIPTFTWTRLFHDLREYIVERQATNHTMLALYHRQFVEVAKEKYLRAETAKKVYKIMCEYFSGYHAVDRRKSLKLKMWNESREVDRKVPQQPLQFSRDIYNLRKLRELPFCLLRSGAWTELTENIFANAAWIEKKIAAFSIKEVIEDYDLALQERSHVEIQLIRDAIKLAKPTLEFQESNYDAPDARLLQRRMKRGGVKNSVLFELYCRLHYFKDEFPNLIGRLVSQCGRYLEAASDEIFIPLNGFFQPPGGPLRTTITGFKTAVSFITFSKNGEMMAMGSKGGELMIWDTVNDEVMHQLDGHPGEVTFISFGDRSGSTHLATCSRNGTIKVFNSDNGNVIATFFDEGLENSSFCCLALDTDRLRCVSEDHATVISIPDKALKRYEMPSKAVCAATGEDFTVVGLANGKCLLHDPATCTETGYVFHPDGGEEPVLSVTVLSVGGVLIAILWRDGCFRLVDRHDLETNNSIHFRHGNVIGGVSSEDQSMFAIFSPARVEVYFIAGPAETEIRHLYTLLDDVGVIVKAIFVLKDEMAVAYENNKVVLWKFVADNEPIRTGSWEGMRAPINHMEVNGNLGVTASQSVFYLKLWNVKHEDVTQLSNTAPLDFENSAVSPDGNSFLFLKHGKVVVHKIERDSHVQARSDQQIWELSVDNESRKKNTVAIAKYSEGGKSIVAFTEEGSVVKFANPAKKEYQPTAKASNTTSPIQMLHLEHTRISRVAVCTKGDRLVAIANTISNTGENHLLFLEAADIQSLTQSALPKSEIDGEVTALAIVDDGTRVIVGTDTGNISLFVAENNYRHIKKVSSLQHHQSPITVIVLNRKQSMFYSGSKGRTRRLWSLQGNDLKLIHELSFESLLERGVTCGQFTRDDRYIITGSQERCVKVWDTNTGVLAGAFYVYATVKDLVVLDNNEVLYTSELGYLARSIFRPSGIRSTSMMKSRSSTSSFCCVM